ncbi:MAG: ABC transporter permease [Candidatus Korarchaeum sp.]|nr:ABC transporter permease [Candidatus Korarchaeum sp.]MDW8036087.1 ABC transporter permease [Candidatus Korarchaeum sp.]
MRLSVYILKRAIYSIFTLLGLSIIVFTLARVLPGDPARMAAGSRAPEWVVEQLRHQLNLDKPLYYQYFYWLSDLVRGDLGYSIVSRRSVTNDAIEYLPATLELVIAAAIFNVVGAIILGSLAGKYANRLVDNFIRVFSYIAISIPSFVWAIILQLVLGWWLQLFPTQGRITEGIILPRVTGFYLIDSLIYGNLNAFLDTIWHLVLPAFALSVGGMAQDARIIRAGMVDNVEKDYILLMRSKGISERLISFKYLLKPSIIPAVTVMGMDIAALLGNAFLVEIIYNWPGFSRYGIVAMLNKDLNAVVAIVLVIGLVFAVANIVVDVIVSFLDPRIRLLEKGE